MSEIWLTSDEHYFHKRILDFAKRPFKDLDEMTQTFIKNHNSVVSKGDRVYHLGDFSFGKYEETQEVLSQLNGQHYHIKGNHDSKETDKLDWVWSRQKSSLKVNGEYFHLDHYPHMSWNRSYYNAFHAFGHVHSTGYDYWFNANSCDVGVDYWKYYPVNAQALVDRLIQVSEIAFSQGFFHHFFWKGRDDDLQFFQFPQDL